MHKNSLLNRRKFIQSSALATAGLFLGEKASAAPLPGQKMKPGQPHIIFIMTDQHRGDALGCAGNSIVKTPHIDSIANLGILFYNGYSSVPSSTPARAGLLTGFSPWNHGMLGYGRVARRYKYEMPRMLRDLGYYTFGIGKMHWFPQKSLHGFNGTLVDESGREEQDGFVSDYRDWFKLNAPGLHPDATGIGWNEHRAGTYKLREDLHPTYWTGQTAVELIENYHLDNPLFLKVSFARPHSPYDPPGRYLDMYKNVDIPAPFKGAWSDEFADFPETPNAAFGNFGKEHAIKSRRHYYASITFIDDQVGRIVDALRKKGMYDDAIICFTSDHGDMLGDHNHWRKTYPYEGSARIPYIMKWPEWMEADIERGTIMTQPVELRDFLPTFLDAAGGDIPEDMDGLSLLSLVRNPRHKWRQYIDMEHATAYRNENYWCALTDGKYKYAWYFRTGKEELFDLIDDRDELVNLAVKSQFQGELLKWRNRMVEHLRERGESFVKDDKLVIRQDTLLYGPNYPEEEELSEGQRATRWRNISSASYVVRGFG
jgi:arylsulfatase